MICPICREEFEPKRVTATVCKKPACVKAQQRQKKKLADMKEAEEGSPDVVWTGEKGDPEPEVAPVTPPVDLSIELRKKLPLSETPLRADVNALARDVILRMGRYKERSELERLEKNQLKK